MDSPLKIGVFLCTCGHMMNDYFDTRLLLDSAARVPGVTCVDENRFLCTRSGLEWLKIKIAQSGCNRIVIAGCSPHQHEFKFMQALEEAGLNRSLLAIANIREGCAWVCSEKSECQPKAQRMIAAAIRRVAQARPVEKVQTRMNPSALVIGAGSTGVRMALELHRLGIQPVLIDRNSQAGQVDTSLLSPCTGGACTETLDQRQQLASGLKELGDKKIGILTSTEVRDVAGGPGAFQVTLDMQGQDKVLEVGSIVVSTGLQSRDGQGLAGVGSSNRIVGLTRLRDMAAGERKTLERIMMSPDKRTKYVCFILGASQGGGSRGAFAKRATVMALNEAIALKKQFKAEVMVAAGDIMVCGTELESLYRLARESGVLFFRFTESTRPEVSLEKGIITVKLYDPALAGTGNGNGNGEGGGGRPISVLADLLILEDEVLPAEGTQNLQSVLRINLNDRGFYREGFFQGGNIHLAPNLSNRKGIFVAGACHGKEETSEILSDIRSVAMAVCSLVSQANAGVERKVVINTEKCALCLTCIRTCPHRAIEVGEVEAGQKWGAKVMPEACQGCGICAGECPAKAIEMVQYSDAQIFSELIF
ncbi:MAG: 4Fe-4S dicluster domain-containing protein [bacterium]